MSSSVATAAISGQSVLRLAFMGSFAYVASPISRLVCLEVVEALRPALRYRSSVTVMGIIPVVDMPVEAVRAMKPRACSQKYPANEPIRPIVAVGSTVIWGIVEVSIRAHRRHSDVYPNGNLSWSHRCRAQQANEENCESQHTDFEHDPPSFVHVSTRTAERQHSTDDQ
jgi:hypothetical protein